jgi:hypothetical protein
MNEYHEEFELILKEMKADLNKEPNITSLD